MRVHLTDSDLEALALKKMDPAALLRASDHVAACAQCGQRLKPWLSAPSWTDEDEEDSSHPAYEQLAGLIDRRLSEAERNAVELHLENCPLCSTDVAGLRMFASRMAAAGAFEPAPGWVGRLRAWLSPRPWLVMAVPVVAVLVALVVAPIVQRKADDTPVRYVLQRPGGSPTPEALAERVIADDNGALRIAPDGTVDLAAPFSEADRLVIAAAIRGEAGASLGNAVAGPSPGASGNASAFTASRGLDPVMMARRDHPNSHLLLGAVYQQQGEWALAEHEYRILLDANPNSRIARELWQRASSFARQSR